MLKTCFLFLFLAQIVYSNNIKIKIAESGKCKLIQISPQNDKIAFTWWDKSNEIYDKLIVFHLSDSALTEVSKYSVTNFEWLSEDKLSYYVSPKQWVNERKKKLPFSEYGPFIYDFEREQAFPDPNSKIEPRKNIVKKSPNIELEKKINSFIEENYKSHPGTLGGTVKYYLKKYLLSPNNQKILFLVIGDDGHSIFNPIIYLSDLNFVKIIPQNNHSDQISFSFDWISETKFIMFQNGYLILKNIEDDF